MDFNLDIRKFLPHQRALLTSKAKVTSLIAGYGAGKSLAAALFLVVNALRNPGVTFLGVSPSYRMCRATLQPAIYEILENFFDPFLLEGTHFKFHETYKYFQFKGGGRIQLASGDQPSTLKGSNIGSAVMDEPGLMDYKVFQQVLARIRDPRMKGKNQLALCGTPEDLNWLYDLCIGEKGAKLRDDFNLIRARTTDNPNLPSDYVQTLESQYDPQLVQAYINGEFVNLTGSLAYYAFSNDNILNEPFEYNKDLPIIIAMDFNYNPNVCLMAQEVIRDGKSKIIVFDEFSANCQTEQKCEAIIDKYGKDQTYELYADAASNNRSAHGVGISDLAILRNCFSGLNVSYRIPTHNPKRRDRLNAVNGKLLNSYKERGILISPSCKSLINDFRRITMDEFILGRFSDSSLGHISDALGYYINYKYPVRDRMAGQPAVSRFSL